ncbi:protein L-Myc-1b-like [Corythoichthys intestinalis]|uniref:protein L-Myc-1b-like n=1 Tax=Corythoichthys intestinalis TaxID=161448 RepID=UPI0025A50081|nr:protein L-Myc-1b-like [Corythoichthys intestinalis]XP_057714711.1 protein L-Myc-1b-like [Corythoichthys intestinalis]XP_057714712.1 protein L-Myc-1b-like [Corythoichthys intestinalis]XP_057714713.1 protein L-Myc-1b-like [Corythoichthys intestinalis]
MELDCYQHYFFDDFDTEEDFYKSTAPSEGIWKKFELLPTPPMSPIRTLQSGDGVLFSTGDKLSWLSRVDECDGQELFGNLSSIIIQDCMWSSFSASKQLEKVVHGRQPAPSQPTGAPPTTHIPVRPSKAHCVSQSLHLTASAADCVDPAAVLTYPASSCRKTASSGSESRSDSSDDEEEIDVVTVESKHTRARLASVRKQVTLTVRADPCPKRFHASVHRQQHNYAARSPDSGPGEDEDDEEEEDDEELQSGHTFPAWSRLPSPSGSSLNSDAEDTDRRKTHNYLERKRRNDLRSRFLALRDQIPGLESTKTPKVAILTHATEYLMELHAKEKRQLQERKRLKARQQHLLRRISALKRS